MIKIIYCIAFLNIDTKITNLKIFREHFKFLELGTYINYFTIYNNITTIYDNIVSIVL